MKTKPRNIRDSYFDLVRQFPLVPIRDEGQYEPARLASSHNHSPAQGRSGRDRALPTTNNKEPTSNNALPNHLAPAGANR